MKKFFLILILAFLPWAGRADEGMWLPLLINRLNYTDMQTMGLKLTAEEIYSVNHASLKDAIVLFGRGCTAEVISEKGLLLTNHHCGYGAIQSKSTVEHDYLTQGFWAMNYSEELPIPGLSVKFLIRIEDVTEKVLMQLTPGMTAEQRNAKIREVSVQLEKDAVKETAYEASVRSFFAGNEYYMFVYQTYKDVRLVGAPPSSIGKFGADTDNWMWPRHTGDFSLFRVYSAPDGSPAEYSSNNIPMKPKYSLPLSIRGVQNGDFTMILGYPGTTERYLTSYGIDYYVQDAYPVRISIREKKLEVMKEGMDASAEVRIRYASKYAGIANYWKNFIGTIKALNRLHVADRKRETEAAFSAWASDGDRSAVYGNVLPDIRKSYDEMKELNLARNYYFEAIRGCEALAFSRMFYDLQKLLTEKAPDKEKIKSKTAELKAAAERLYKDYDPEVDIRLTAEMFRMYYTNVPAVSQPEYFKSLAVKYKSDFNRLVRDQFRKSIFGDAGKVKAFLESPDTKVLRNDALYMLMNEFADSHTDINNRWNAADSRLNTAMRLFIDGLRQMYPDRKFYPDANQTMRLTYGKVMDYYPADAVHYDYYTTLDGVMAKEDPLLEEFVVPARLKELYKNRDFGPYAQNGVMHTCFISNNDITGGNSGSPVLDANGYLVGLAFDGNWEAMSGNFCFEPDLQRTINVDIRYVLFVIDKYAGAHNLIAEMKIIQ